MKLGRIIGTVWATRKYPSLEGKKLLIVQPLNRDMQNSGKPLCAVDSVGAGKYELIFFVTSREAAIPFSEKLIPIDAAVVGIVDHLDQ